ncbi:CaiB/BaiF CoA-transferase family protein [Fictibacillus sp. B-59209]|uniref:CaiB/BaiF CoA transferase family protein n=1 Tax=Fictibacillus sp. B-59209 TaxID=3024873 RepID=UPI002E1DCD74|nr:CaiB/BaiF CoA-transferase family protein [Fictibacillus sp. B-59209]
MKILEGITILDLTGLVPGPFTSMLFADYGAEVIKIERPGLGETGRHLEPLVDGSGRMFEMLNRNKKSITLNLKSSEGKEIFRKLAQQADVIIEGFRPGVMDRLGLGYEDISVINERVIYCSLSGFGQTGSLKNLAAHDINYASYSGFLGTNVTADGTISMPGSLLGDIAGGYMPATIGILLAILGRERTGIGQYVDISIVDGLFSLLLPTLAEFLDQEKNFNPSKTWFTGAWACYNVYQSKDGKYITIGPLEEKFWHSFCQLIERPDFIDIQFEPEKQEDMRSEIAAYFKQKNRDVAIDEMIQMDIPAAPVQTIDDVINSEWVKERNLLFEREGKDGGRIIELGSPFKLSNSPAEYKTLPPELGQHNDEILSRIGFVSSDISELREQGVI